MSVTEDRSINTISRIAAIGLMGLLVVALIGGSAYILLRPNDAGVARAAGPTNRSDSAAGQQGNGYQGGRGAQGQLAGREGGNGYQGGSAGQGRQAENGTLGEGLAKNLAATWEILSGSVVKPEDNELTVETGNGNVTVHLGPEWYWETKGMPLAEGDQVEVSGFYEGDTFEVASIEKLSNEESVILRDETGRPLWAGRGRGRQTSRN